MEAEDMKVVILCGGRGTRFHERTEFKPKPLIEIGGKPILWHIMKIYAHYGYRDFILCLGYKGEIIKGYFLNYEFLNSDFTIELGHKSNVKIHSSLKDDWQVTLADTGLNAMTGARIKRIEKYVDTDLFMLTYGDGVADIDIAHLVDFHRAHGKIGTVTGVRPPSRFGELVVKGDMVGEFSEKPQIREGYINGGYFVFDRRMFDYVEDNDNCSFEREPLERLAQDNQLAVFAHQGYWQCMDTYRDWEDLNRKCEAGNPPWKVW